MNRRQFLGTACGAAAGWATPRVLANWAGAVQAPAALAGPAFRKVLIVVFGGGTRYSESVGDAGHCHIPRLWNELVPAGTLFDNVRVEGRVVHTNCTASILTGHREYDADNDWTRPPDRPTLFEIVRRERRLPDTSAWAFVYASILARLGYSRAAGFGLDYAANVVEPPTVPREIAEGISSSLQQAAVTGSTAAELAAAKEAAERLRANSRLATDGLRSAAAREFVARQFAAWRAGRDTTSHDAFLAHGALAAMRGFAPDVVAVAFGEIDCAHYGSWSRYTDAIRRTDELAWRLWRAADEMEAYRGRTLTIVLPDHGRELERPGGLGYVHHSDFYTGTGEDEGCRRVWMLLQGPGVAPGKRVSRPVPQTAAAATALEFLGLKPAAGASASVLAG